MKFRFKIHPLFWLPLLLWLAQCGPKGERFAEAPLILITIDTLRSDHLPAYGYSGIETPNMDAFAGDAVLFERAFSHYPMTLPSHASMFTGLWPSANGVRDNLGFVLDERYETLAELLKDEGYRTGAVVSSMVLRKTTGIAQGFDFFDDQLKRGSRRGIVNYAERRGDASLEIAKTWLADQPDSKFFFWLHLFDPHTPYEPPEAFQNRGAVPYDDEIGYTDHLLGDLFAHLKEKGLYDPAIIILTSDHGEGLGDHGEMQHGLLLYREVLQVPLMVKLPQSKLGGTRDTRLVGLSDLAPTSSMLLGFPPLGDSHALFSGTIPSKRVVYSETFNPMLNFGWVPQQSVIGGDHHYIYGASEQMFDLVKDPAETQNLLPGETVPGRWRKLLEGIGREVEIREDISQEEAELLRSLGYVGGGATDDAAAELDEAGFLKLFNLVGECNLLLNRGEYKRVEQLLSPVVERFPSMLDARLALGSALSKLGKLEAAEDLYLDSLNLAPGNLTAMVALVETELAMGKKPQAQILINKAVEQAPKLGPRLLLPVINRYDWFPLAEEVAAKVLTLEPNFGLARIILAKAAVKKNQFSEADKLLDEIEQSEDIERDPFLTAELEFTRGDSAARQDRLTQAVEHFREAIQAYPDHQASRTSLSLLYFSTNQQSLALENLDDWLTRFPNSQNFHKAGKLCEIVGLSDLAKQYLAKSTAL